MNVRKCFLSSDSNKSLTLKEESDFLSWMHTNPYQYQWAELESVTLKRNDGENWYSMQTLYSIKPDFA